MALSSEEEQELASIEQELQARQAPQQSSGLTPEEEFELATIDQELATREQAPAASVNPSREASLGFVNRARYAIEPLESNRMALLAQEYGQENIQQDDKGNVYLKQNGQFRPVNKPGFSTADVADFAGALPEMAGGVVGMGVGAVGGGGVASIPLAMGLGAAGGGLGSIVRQGTSALLGTPQVATVVERASETGLSAGIGGAFGGAGQALKLAAPSIKSGAKSVADVFKRGVQKVPGAQSVGEVIESSSKATKGVIDSLNKTFSFKRAEDADELLKLADEIGVDKSILPEAIEYGDKSMISRSARTIAEGPLGEERLVRFQQAHNQVSNALDNSIAKMSPSGSTMSRDEAGQFIMDSVDEAKKNFFNSLDETYSNLVANAPGLKINEKAMARISSKLEGVRTFAIGREKRGFGDQGAQAKSLLKTVAILKNSKSSVKQMSEALKNLGEAAFDKEAKHNKLPIDQKKMQELYFTVRDELIETFRGHYGDDVAENLIRNNKMVTDFIGENSVLAAATSKKNIAPEHVFKALIENGDTRKAEALMAVLPQDKVQMLKSSFLSSIVKRNADGDVLFDATIKAMDKKKELISKLFTPEEMGDVAKVLRFGKRMGNPIMSSSGTGASNSFNDFLNQAKSAIVNESTLDLAKKRGAKPPRPPIKSSPSRKYIPSGPGKTGSYGNILFDASQREGAYFTRGPAGNKNERKK